MDLTVGAAQGGESYGDPLHGAFDGCIDLDAFADAVLIFGGYEDAGDEIFHECLCTETRDQAEYAGSGEQRPDVDTDGLKREKERDAVHDSITDDSDHAFDRLRALVVPVGSLGDGDTRHYPLGDQMNQYLSEYDDKDDAQRVAYQLGYDHLQINGGHMCLSYIIF